MEYFEREINWNISGKTRKDVEIESLRQQLAECQRERDNQLRQAYDNGFVVGTNKSESHKANKELRNEIERLEVLLATARADALREAAKTLCQGIGSGAVGIELERMADEIEKGEKG